MADFDRMCAALEKGEADGLKSLVQAALSEGVSAEDILNKGLLRGMDKIGDDFKNSKCFVPDVIFAARAMTSAMELLQPILTEKGVEPVGRVVIGTVRGDLHDIGKNLVGMMLRGGGFEVIDLGADVAPEKFIDAAKKSGQCLIGMSALLTTTMPVMEEVVTAVKKAKLPGVKTMIGGAPVTQDYAGEIGADGYAPDAATAVDLARKLMGAKTGVKAAAKPAAKPAAKAAKPAAKKPRGKK